MGHCLGRRTAAGERRHRPLAKALRSPPWRCPGDAVLPALGQQGLSAEASMISSFTRPSGAEIRGSPAISGGWAPRAAGHRQPRGPHTGPPAGVRPSGRRSVPPPYPCSPAASWSMPRLRRPRPGQQGHMPFPQQPVRRWLARSAWAGRGRWRTLLAIPAIQPDRPGLLSACRPLAGGQPNGRAASSAARAAGGLQAESTDAPSRPVSAAPPHRDAVRW